MLPAVEVGGGANRSGVGKAAASGSGSASQAARSVANVETAVATDPSFGEAHLKLAIARWWKREGGEDADSHGGPAQTLELLLSSDVKLSDEHRSLSRATLALVRHDYEAAYEEFSALTERYPDNKEAWYGLGEAMFHGGDGKRSKKAAGAFERAVELDPAFRLGYFHLLEPWATTQALWVMQR